jgi:hypothetical protein
MMEQPLAMWYTSLVLLRLLALLRKTLKQNLGYSSLSQTSCRKKDLGRHTLYWVANT